MLRIIREVWSWSRRMALLRWRLEAASTSATDCAPHIRRTISTDGVLYGSHVETSPGVCPAAARADRHRTCGLDVIELSHFGTPGVPSDAARKRLGHFDDGSRRARTEPRTTQGQGCHVQEGGDLFLRPSVVREIVSPEGDVPRPLCGQSRCEVDDDGVVSVAGAVEALRQLRPTFGGRESTCVPSGGLSVLG